MHHTLRVIFLLSALALAGCASVGNQQLRHETQESLAQKIEKGVSSKADVQARLGSADSTSFTDAGNEIWTYRHIKSTAKAINYIPVANWFAGGANQDKRELVILFDENGIVKNYTYSATQGEVRTGVIAQ